MCGSEQSKVANNSTFYGSFAKREMEFEFSKSNVAIKKSSATMKGNESDIEFVKEIYDSGCRFFNIHDLFYSTDLVIQREIYFAKWSEFIITPQPVYKKFTQKQRKEDGECCIKLNFDHF